MGRVQILLVFTLKHRSEKCNFNYSIVYYANLRPFEGQRKASE